MTDFEVTLALPVWARVRPGNPEAGLAFDRTKRRFWRRNLGWGQDLIRLETRPDTLPLAEAVTQRRGKVATLGRPVREGTDDNYDTSLIDRMEEKSPQFNLRNVDRFVMENDTDTIEWAESPMPDRRAYEKDLAEVRSARHEAPDLGETLMAGATVGEVRQSNRRVFQEIDWGEWLGQERKRDSGGRLWTYQPPDGGKRTRPWEDIRIVEHKFWKGRLITEKY